MRPYGIVIVLSFSTGCDRAEAQLRTVIVLSSSTGCDRAEAQLQTDNEATPVPNTRSAVGEFGLMLR